jgi:hypothetical protein
MATILQCYEAIILLILLYACMCRLIGDAVYLVFIGTNGLC